MKNKQVLAGAMLGLSAMGVSAKADQVELQDDQQLNVAAVTTVADSQQSLKDAQAAAEQAEKVVEQSHGEVVDTREKIKALEGQMQDNLVLQAESEKKIVQEQQLADEVKVQVAEQETKVMDVSGAIEAERQRLTEVTQQQDAANQVVQKVEQEHKVVQQGVESAQNHLQQKQQQIEAGQAKRNEAVQQVTDSAQALQDAQVKVEQAQQDQAKHQATVEQHAATLERQEIKRAELKAEQEAKAQAWQSVQTQQKASEANVEKLKLNVTEIQKQAPKSGGTPATPSDDDGGLPGPDGDTGWGDYPERSKIMTEAVLPDRLIKPKNVEQTQDNWGSYGWYRYEPGKDTSAKVSNNVISTAQQKELADYTLTLINGYRKENNLPPLTMIQASFEAALSEKEVREDKVRRGEINYNDHFVDNTYFKEKYGYKLTPFQNLGFIGNTDYGSKGESMLQLKVNILNMLTAMVWQDGGENKWGHRENILLTPWQGHEMFVGAYMDETGAYNTNVYMLPTKAPVPVAQLNWLDTTPIEKPYVHEEGAPIETPEYKQAQAELAEAEADKARLQTLQDQAYKQWQGAQAAEADLANQIKATQQAQRDAQAAHRDAVAAEAESAQAVTRAQAQQVAAKEAVAAAEAALEKIGDTAAERNELKAAEAKAAEAKRALDDAQGILDVAKHSWQAQTDRLAQANQRVAKAKQEHADALAHQEQHEQAKRDAQAMVKTIAEGKQKLESRITALKATLVQLEAKEKEAGIALGVAYLDVAIAEIQLAADQEKNKEPAPQPLEQPKTDGNKGTDKPKLEVPNQIEKPKTENKPEAKPEEKPKAENKPETKPEEKPKAENKPEAQPEEKPKAENKPETKPEEKPKAENKPETKPEEKPKAENKPETQPEEKPKAENKPETKPEEKPKAENKPETKPEEKPLDSGRGQGQTPTPKPESETKPEAPKGTEQPQADNRPLDGGRGQGLTPKETEQPKRPSEQPNKGKEERPKFAVPKPMERPAQPGQPNRQTPEGPLTDGGRGRVPAPQPGQPAPQQPQQRPDVPGQPQQRPTQPNGNGSTQRPDGSARDRGQNQTVPGRDGQASRPEQGAGQSRELPAQPTVPLSHQAGQRGRDLGFPGSMREPLNQTKQNLRVTLPGMPEHLVTGNGAGAVRQQAPIRRTPLNTLTPVVKGDVQTLPQTDQATQTALTAAGTMLGLTTLLGAAKRRRN